MTDDIRERLLKVYRLAEQGVGGEKANAEVMLAKLLKRHGMTIADLTGDDQPKTTVWFKYTDNLDRSLVIGIAHRICGRTVDMWNRTNSKAKVIGVDCTAAQRVEIEVYLDVYRPAQKRAMDEARLAFQFRHGLFDQTPRDDDAADTMTEDEKARIRALSRGFQNVDSPARRIKAGA